MKLLFSVWNFLISLNYMPVIFVLLKFFSREIFFEKFFSRNVVEKFLEFSGNKFARGHWPNWTDINREIHRVWARMTASDRGKLWKPLINFLRMREWSNFTRNAIDQLQIVLTNLKSKLGKFLWCLKTAKLIFQSSETNDRLRRVLF